MNETGISTLAPHLTSAVRRTGYVFAERFGVDIPTEALSHMLGSPVALNGGSPVHEITPKSIQGASPNTYSGLYGFGQFPMHTDMAHWQIPPRYMMLRCVKGDPNVATHLRDSRPLIAKLGAETLLRTFVYPRRPLQGKMHVLHLLESENQGHGAFRWDQTFLKPATASSKEIFERIALELKQAAEISLTLLNPGDTLVFDNWRMLHARSQVADERTDRTIERVYFGGLH